MEFERISGRRLRKGFKMFFIFCFEAALQKWKRGWYACPCVKRFGLTSNIRVYGRRDERQERTESEGESEGESENGDRQEQTRTPLYSLQRSDLSLQGHSDPPQPRPSWQLQQLCNRLILEYGWDCGAFGRMAILVTQHVKYAPY